MKGPLRDPDDHDDEIIKKRTKLLNTYKDFLDQPRYGERFDSRSNLHSSVLEEFVYYLFRDLVKDFSNAQKRLEEEAAAEAREGRRQARPRARDAVAQSASHGEERQEPKEGSRGTNTMEKGTAAGRQGEGAKTAAWLHGACLAGISVWKLERIGFPSDVVGAVRILADGMPQDGTPWHVEHAKHFSMNDETVVIVSDEHGVLRTLPANEVTHEMPSDTQDDETAGQCLRRLRALHGFR